MAVFFPRCIFFILFSPFCSFIVVWGLGFFGLLSWIGFLGFPVDGLGPVAWGLLRFMGLGLSILT